MNGYCFRCRGERQIAGARTVVMKNGRWATEGKCEVCGTRLYRLGRDDREETKDGQRDD